MKKILIFAAFIYLLIVPFTYHPDTKLTLYYASLNHQKIFDIYTYLHQHPSSVPDFYYPPFHYWLLKIQYFLASPIAGSGFDRWLNADSRAAAADPNIYRYNFAAKWPLLVLTLVTGYLLYRLVKQNTKKESKALFAAAFWLFNPITLYTVVMMGQNDIFAIFFFILGWYLYTTSAIFPGLIAIGIAGATKNYPLFWAVFLVFTTSQKLIAKIIHLSVPFLFFIATLIPFIKFPYFRQAVFQSGLSTRMFISTLNLGFNDQLPIVPLLLMILFFITLTKKPTFLNQTTAILTTSLIILGFSHFHPQWFLWLIPFIAIWLTTYFQPLIPLLLFAAWAVITLLFDDKFLYWGIISPLNPSLFNLPIIRQFLTNKIDIDLINNLAHSLIAATSLVFLFQKFKPQVIVLPNFHKINFRRLKLISLTVFLFLALIVINLPLLKSNFVESDITYSALTPISSTITAQTNGLTRLELAFNNPNLLDNNNYSLLLTNAIGTPIVQQNFNGFNLGSPSHLRLDLPIQTNSANQSYTLTITPQSAVKSLLEIGQSHDQIARIEYYQPSLKPQTVFYQSLSFIQKLFSSNLIWLVFELILLFA